MASTTIMNPVNLTPHDVVIQVDDRDVVATSRGDGNMGTKRLVSLKKSGYVVRGLSKTQVAVGTVGSSGIPVYTPQEFCGIDGFPYSDSPKEAHPPILVAMVIAHLIPEWYRGAVYTPDTGPGSVVRNSKGQIVAVRRLCLVRESTQ